MGSHDVETMKKLLLTVVMIFGLHSLTVSADPLDVQPAGIKTEDVAEIRNIILGQLDAFREDDAIKAFLSQPRKYRRYSRRRKFF